MGGEVYLGVNQKESPQEDPAPPPWARLDLSQHSSAGAKDRIAPPPPAPQLLARLPPLPLFRSVLCSSRCVRRFFCRILVPGELASGELASLGEAPVCAACDAR